MLTSVVIPESLSNIGKNAFCDCDSLPKEIKEKLSKRNETTLEEDDLPF